MPALALTDYGNMFGAIEFYFAALERGVKPLFGLEVYLAPSSRLKKELSSRGEKIPQRRLVLLAKNFEGYQNLCRLSSSGFQEGFYYRPRVDYEVLQQHSQGLIALSGGTAGEVPYHFAFEGPDATEQVILNLKKIYKHNFYLELNRTGEKLWTKLEPFLLDMGRRHNIPLVAANNVHYLKPDDQMAQEILICIASNKLLSDESRFKLPTNEFYFKSPDQMKKLFHDLPEACDNTLAIADSCGVELKIKNEQGTPICRLPSFPTPKGKSEQDEIHRIAQQGLQLRFEQLRARGEAVQNEQAYHDRLKKELDVIHNMGFNGYFLIVQDFINWSKQHNIPVGPGRGSGAGSLVAYALGITDLDPMPYNLIFERFLNPERVSMPDFDVDFCQSGRGRVIEYVKQKYSNQRVSQIITYGKLQARAALRDVGRVLGMSFTEQSDIIKLIPDRLGITLQEAIKEEPRLTELMEEHPRVKLWLDLAQKIEGLCRHAGVHAAGVIISDDPIVSIAPLYRAGDGEQVVQYDMKMSEKIGLVKFDFLGLKTLTHIQHTLKLVNKNHNKQLKVEDISLSDPGIYKLMQKGDTKGIFQFESEGITDLIVKSQPTRFEDIVAINALYRPGPMDMIPDYLDRKHGRKPCNYMFDDLEDILKETYGIVVYQEQVQLIAARVASFSLGEADILRRAMGKKIAHVMQEQKIRFLDGARKNKRDPAKAALLFDQMAEFAKYGFNKSHAAAYCVVAAQTAYFKYYYPAEFYAGLLSTEMSDTDKVVKYIKDAKAHGIRLQSPHINHSSYEFSATSANKTSGGDAANHNGRTSDNETQHADATSGDVTSELYFSLGAIKGVGQAAVEAIVQARESKAAKKFESLEDFFETVELQKINKKTIEALVKAGALDGFGYHRAQLVTGFSKFIQQAQQRQHNMRVGQLSLFSMDDTVEEKLTLPEQDPWLHLQELNYEKEVLGFYLSGHPLKGLQGLIKKWVTHTLADVLKASQNLEEKKAVTRQATALVLVASVREIITKKGTRMAFVQAEDLTSSCEVIVFPDVYTKAEKVLKPSALVLVTGRIDKGNKIMAEEVKPLASVLQKASHVQVKASDDKDFEALHDLVQAFPGSIPLDIEIDLTSLKQQVLLRSKQGIQPSYRFFEQAQRALKSLEGVALN